MTSAWAVGSQSQIVRLPERARILPSWMSTAPMGTSPAAAAARASARAFCMNRVSASILRERITCGGTKNGPSTDRVRAVERQNALLDNWGVEKQTKPMRELLERLFQVDFLKGLAVTFRTQHPKN